MTVKKTNFSQDKDCGVGIPPRTGMCESALKWSAPQCNAADSAGTPADPDKMTVLFWNMSRTFLVNTGPQEPAN